MDKFNEKFARHIQLSQIGAEKQHALVQSHIAIVGLGGLGCAAASYLAISGIGRITLIDYDIVELSNLSRQILHYEDDIGRAKVASASEKLRKIAPSIQLHCIENPIELEDLTSLFTQFDLILDCTDNFTARHAINTAALKTGKNWISGAAIGWHGSVMAFTPSQNNAPCYACVYPQVEDVEGVNCQQQGVVSPLVGIIGTLQAQWTLNVLLGLPKGHPEMLQFDAQNMQFMSIKVKKRPHCRACCP